MTLDQLSRHVRHAARSLGRSPVFVAVSALSIALGVGATTGIVTIANTLLLRPPPGIGNPDGVVTIGRTQDGRGFDNFSYPNFLDYRSAQSLRGLAAVRLDPLAASLAGPGGGEPVRVSLVSANFFAVLETRPGLGRFFAVDEDRAPGDGEVAVLGYDFFKRRFGADSSVLGRTLVLNGSPFTVIGVAAPRFQGPFLVAPDLWVPITAATRLGDRADLFSERRGVWLMGVGRLASGAGLSQAQAELSTIAARLAREYPDANAGHGVAVERASLVPGDGRRSLAGFMVMLLGLAGLVLAVACTNVAGMLLVRGTTRRREMAVRLALGGSRAQLMTQLVAEGLLVFLLAGALGLVLARWIVDGLLALVPRLPVQLAFDPRLDWRVLGVAAALTLLSGLAAGIVPAFHSTRPELLPALKGESGTTSSGERLRLRNGLLVAQVAFSMLLLVVAGLFARALGRARDIDPGFDPRGVQIATLDLSLATRDSTAGRQLAASILNRARALGGVRSAALTAMLPLDGGGLGFGGILIPGREAPTREGWNADWNVVTPGYFGTLGIPLLEGRDFSNEDRSGTGDVAILNQTFAAALFPGQDPVGRVLTNEGRAVTVIGVARDAKYRSLGEPPRNFIYVPLSQRYFERTSLLVKSTATGGAGDLPAELRRIVAEADRALPVLQERTLVEQAATSLFPQRVAVDVSAGLGVVALLLALLGIYGVTAFGVAQRTREIGVRVALGARPAQVLGLVLRHGVALAGVGVVCGGIAAVGATRLLRSLLYGVSPADGPAFGVAAGLLLLAAVAASWVPARRAAGVDPVEALRSE